MKEPLTITTQRVDDIPLLLAQMQRMGLARLLDAHFPTHGNRQGLSLGVVTTIWLTHLLSQEVIYMIIRTIRPDDAEQFLCLCLQLDEETQFMLLEPGERTISVEQQRKHIEQVLSRENQLIFVAEHDGQLIGYLSAAGGYYKRNRHSAEIVIGILQDFTGQGVGTQLFMAMEEWARQKQLHRLELTVMTHNKAGVALYKKRGFEVEGIKRHAIVINGQYVDEYYMAKLLE